MKKNRRFYVWLLFALYGLVLLVLLFHRPPHEGHNYNITPLKTIRDYFTVLGRDDPVGLSLRPYALTNFLGNILVFVPLGVFLPKLFRRQRNIFLFLLTVMLLVCVVELLQLTTRRGALDVDDLLLNVPGACLGWLGWKLFNSK